MSGKKKTPPPVVKPEIFFVEDLIDQVAAGALRVPKFQRPYVWKPVDILDLFDSIRRRYPIGSLLVWETNQRVASFDSVGPLKIPSSSAETTSYVLDGHQRLASLFGVLRLPAQFPRDQSQDNWRWWVWYDPEEDEFTHCTSKDPPLTWLPMRSVLRTVDFLTYSRALSAHAQADTYIERAEAIADAVKKYRVPITRIVGGELEDAVEIFSRLNNLGRNISPDEMVSALTYSEGPGGFHLASRISEIAEELSAYGFAGFDRRYIFHAVSAIAGIRARSTGDETRQLQEKKKELPKVVDGAEDALVKAAEFVSKRLGVISHRLLPYSNQLVMLGVFFHHCARPNNSKLQILRSWFWLTSFSGWFASANAYMVNLALDEMKEFAKSDRSEFSITMSSPSLREFPDRFDSRSARVRTLLLALIRLKPLSPSGQEIDIPKLLSEDENSGGLPHVFPRAGDKVSSAGNRILLPKLPGMSIRTQLLQTDDALRAKVFESHCVDAAAAKCLENNDAIGFVAARESAMAAMERRFIAELHLPLPARV